MADDDDPLSPGGALRAYAGVLAKSDVPLVGRQLGGYRITASIAEGGMGQVYRAERSDGSFEREVAIKVSVGSAFSADLKDRFLREQQILAGLNHPHICQLFDAGITEEGWPYLIMELIDGMSIDDYSVAHELLPDEVAVLMQQATEAVAFAHSRLVVHRDLKPSNVLVTNGGQVKVLDFGIAKLLDQEAAETQARPMTPSYASPEQLLGQNITIASDIYQLGVLLAELSARAPLASETLADAIERSAEARPRPLSGVHHARMPRELRLIAEQCLKADPADRYPDANALKRDLDSYISRRPVDAVGITLAYRCRKFIARNAKALAGSAAAGLVLAGGIQGLVWLAGEDPCPDPRALLADTWNPKMRAALLSAFSATGLSYAPAAAHNAITGLDEIAAAWGAMHVEACEANRIHATQSDAMLDQRMMCLEDRRIELDAVLAQLTHADQSTVDNSWRLLERLQDLSRCADLPELATTVDPPSPDVAQQVAELKGELAGVRTAYASGNLENASRVLPELRGEIRAIDYAPLIAAGELVAGMVLSSRSEAGAEDAFEAAITQASSVKDDYLLAESWIEYAFALSEHLGKADSARQHMLATRSAVERVAADSNLRLRLINLEGGLAFREGNFSEAKAQFEKALVMAEDKGQARSEMIRLNLANAHRLLGELDTASALADQALRELSRMDGDDSPRAIMALETLAFISKEAGDHRRSVEYMRRVIQILQTSLGARHHKVARAKKGLAWSLKEQGNLTDALVLMEEALAIQQSLEAAPQWSLASTHNDLGDLLMYLSRFDESENHLQTSLSIWGKDPDNPWASYPLTNLGILWNRTGRYQQAYESCARALALDISHRGEDNRDLAYSMTCMGEALLGLLGSDQSGEAKSEQLTEAVGLLRRSVALRSTHPDYELAWSRFLLARALLESGNRTEGEREIEQSLQLFERFPPPDPHMRDTIRPYLG